jgi:hypothetical protein
MGGREPNDQYQLCCAALRPNREHTQLDDARRDNFGPRDDLDAWCGQSHELNAPAKLSVESEFSFLEICATSARSSLLEFEVFEAGFIEVLMGEHVHDFVCTIESIGTDQSSDEAQSNLPIDRVLGEGDVDVIEFCGHVFRCESQVGRGNVRGDVCGLIRQHLPEPDSRFGKITHADRCRRGQHVYEWRYLICCTNSVPNGARLIESILIMCHQSRRNRLVDPVWVRTAGRKVHRSVQ